MAQKKLAKQKKKRDAVSWCVAFVWMTASFELCVYNKLAVGKKKTGQLEESNSTEATATPRMGFLLGRAPWFPCVSHTNTSPPARQRRRCLLDRTKLAVYQEELWHPRWVRTETRSTACWGVW